MIVDEDKWRDAVKFLMGLGCNPSLSPKDQRKLRSYMRGPFALGMSAEDAESIIYDSMGWRKRGKDHE